VGDGWFGLIFDMCTHLKELMDMNPGLEIVCVQLKEKFGGLRFYCTVNAGACENWGSKMFRKFDGWLRTKTCMHGFAKSYWAMTNWRKKHIFRTVYEMASDIVDKAEIESSHTCERCGEVGKTRTNRSWLVTLCDKCEKIRVQQEIAVEREYAKIKKEIEDAGD
jgi:formylmethanofuran dehydrogenase subunit E